MATMHYFSGWEGAGFSEGDNPRREYMHQLKRLPGETKEEYDSFCYIVGKFVTRNTEPPFYFDLHLKAQKLSPSILRFWRNPHPSGTYETLPPLPAAEIMPDKVAHRDRRMTRIMMSAAGSSVLGMAVMMGLSWHEASPLVDDVSPRATVAQSADYLRQLGICEADMKQLEAADKEIRNAAKDTSIYETYKMRTLEDATAAKVAREADLPCVNKPEATAVHVIVGSTINAAITQPFTRGDMLNLPAVS